MERACAQHFSVRGNMLLLPTGTLNVGVSYDLNRNMQVDLAVAGNPIKTNKFSVMSGIVQPGYRYWFRETNYSHFLSVYLNAGAYDLLFNKISYNGFLLGAGLSYGYYFPIKKRLNIGIEVGASFVYARDVNQRVDTPDDKDHYIHTTNRMMLIPSKCEVSIVYLF